MFTIPNNVKTDSYAKGKENFLHTKKERHMLLSGETLALSPVLNLPYTEFCTQFRTKIQRNSLTSYAVFTPNYIHNAISALDTHSPPMTQFLACVTPHFQRQRLAQLINVGAKHTYGNRKHGLQESQFH